MLQSHVLREIRDITFALSLSLSLSCCAQPYHVSYQSIQVIDSFASTLPDRITTAEYTFTITSSAPAIAQRATITGNIPELPAVCACVRNAKHSSENVRNIWQTSHTHRNMRASDCSLSLFQALVFR
jgi:hypothetical protein